MSNSASTWLFVLGWLALGALLPEPARAGACITQTCSCDDDCPGLVCSADGVCCGPPITGTPCPTAGQDAGPSTGGAGSAGTSAGTGGTMTGAGGTMTGAGGTTTGTGGTTTGTGGSAGVPRGESKSDDGGCSAGGPRPMPTHLGVWLAAALAWLSGRTRRRYS